MIKVIHTPEEYAIAVAELSALLRREPPAGTPDADRAELLALLIEEYERSLVPQESVDPIAALEFRMDQLGLAARDLVPFIGSRSKVSEVLSGKRSLSLPMIRALADGLGIPVESLVGRRADDPSEADDVDWTRFPLKEMVRRRWLEAPPAVHHKKASAQQVLTAYFAPWGGPTAMTAALHRRTDHVRGGRDADVYSLSAWTARVLYRAAEASPRPPVDLSTLDETWSRSLVQLSAAESGPTLAVDFLREVGILLIIEDVLPRTRLDGAAMRHPNGWAVLALTLRYDRIDNFWFTLAHELGHLRRHLAQPTAAASRFFDDLDVRAEDDVREAEADAFASELLVPAAEWEASAARFVSSPEACQDLADRLGIHPAIVAGRVRRLSNNYRLLSQHVGSGEVRILFTRVPDHAEKTPHES